MSIDAEIAFGPFRLRGRLGPLTRDGREIRLQPKALAVLWTLALQRGDVVTKDCLLDAVWPGQDVGEQALTFQIQKLRKEMEQDPRDPKYLLTVHRVGFRLAAGPEVASPNPSPSPSPSLGHPFAGRRRELEQLGKLRESTMAGKRQVVLITGEAGIGKTALLEAFSQKHPESLALWGHCLETLGAGDAFMPILEALGQLLRSQHAEQAVDILERLAPSWLRHLPLSLDERDKSRLKIQRSGAKQANVLHEIADALETIASLRPLLLVIEDLHWSDEATLRLITLLARRRGPARLLLVCTSRPIDGTLQANPVRRLQRDLISHGQAHHLPLDCLLINEVAEFLRLRMIEAPPSDWAEQILRRSGGHPLFLRHIVDHIEQSGLSQLSITADSAIPPQLRDMLELQLSELALTDQLLLEAASICGVEFDAAAVAAASSLSPQSVESHLDLLAKKGLFLHDAGLHIWPDGTIAGRFRFRHSIYEQMLQERLTSSRKARLHRSLAERLESAYGARSNEIALQLALHYEQGGMLSKAAQYCAVGARIALSRVSLGDVRLLTRRGLSLTATLQPGAERQRLELALHIALASAVQIERGYADAEVGDHVEPISLLMAGLDDADLLESALATLWLYRHFRGEIDEALVHAERVQQLGVRLGRPSMICGGLAWAAISLMVAGRHRESEAASDQALRQIEELSSNQVGDVLVEPYCAALLASAVNAGYLGHLETGLRRSQRGVETVRRLGNPFLLCNQLTNGLGNLLAFKRDWDGLLRHSRDAAVFAIGVGHQEAAALANLQEASALCELGRLDIGLERLQELVHRQYQTGRWMGLPLACGVLARALLQQGDVAQARRTIELGKAVAKTQGVALWLPELLRVEAHVIAAEAPDDERRVRGKLHEALALAESREARLHSRRIAIDLARRMLVADEREAVVEMLRPLDEPDLEEHEDPDIAQIRMLLGMAAETGS